MHSIQDNLPEVTLVVVG